MSKDNLNTSVNDRTVYVSAGNVADLPEEVAKGISQCRVYSLNSSNGEKLRGKMNFILYQFTKQLKTVG